VPPNLIQFESVGVRGRRVVANGLALELRRERRATGAVTHLVAAAGDTHYFFLAFPAWDRAMATACFWGLPAFISVLMLAEIVLGDLPRFRGTYECTNKHGKSYAKRCCVAAPMVYHGCIAIGSGRGWESPRSVSLEADTRRSYPVRAGFGWRTLNTVSFGETSRLCIWPQTVLAPRGSGIAASLK